MELIVGHVYRAKKPRNCQGYFNDRQVLSINMYTLSYDSVTVKIGQHYPCVTISKFLEWAGEDVTEGYLENYWELWKSKR